MRETNIQQQIDDLRLMTPALGLSGYISSLSLNQTWAHVNNTILLFQLLSLNIVPS